MNIAEIESELQALADAPFDAATFVFRFLEIYDAPKATLTKLKQGSANHATAPGDVLWKNKLFFRVATRGQAANAVDEMMADPLVKRHRPRFIFATDGVETYCRDVKADQTVDPSFKKLNDAFLFFLPLAGIERYEAAAENEADIKATGRIAKLYDEILRANPDWIDRDHTHELNLFMTRMLFCFFAESTSIFEKHIFTNTVMNRTAEDGSDTHAVLSELFIAMNTPKTQRGGLPEYVRRFEYVNGGLFRDETSVPKFSKRARRLMKECGELDWKAINPDIFGSMIQAVAQPGLREDMGLHYTSIPNIMKVLQPLFLLSLEEEFEAARDSEARLKKLLQRIYNIRVFDPACGSGNFLIIAYKELRKLEMRIFERQKHIAKQWSLAMTGVHLNQFFGIELTDFAAETAKLSLWIAEYQMNEQFKEAFGKSPPALPLRDSGNIIRDNATRRNWNELCPRGEGEIFVVGNPPYLGRAQQTTEQKADIISVFTGVTKKFKKLDYVACWMLKGAEYCEATGAQCAFVTTNSLCQGEQVGLFWPLVFARGLEIGFAHQSFKWRNNAAKNAGIICIVVCIRAISKSKKILYSGDLGRIVSNINAYLIDAEDVFVFGRSKSISKLPLMTVGNQPIDDGNLLLSSEERNALLHSYPEAEPLLRRFLGSKEFIRGIERWCLWIPDENLDLALRIPPVAARIRAVSQFRMSSGREETREQAATPHRFVFMPYQDKEAVIVPKVSSERRRYLPVGMLPAGTVVSDLAFTVYGAPDHLMPILSSRLHLVWTGAVGGRIKSDFRYSNTLVYNTFPVPDLSADQKAELEDRAVAILGAREQHPGKSLAWLYNEATMPRELQAAHRQLDDTLEQIYIGRPFRSDAERLEHLVKRYAAALKKGAAGTTRKRLLASEQRAS